MATHFCEPVAPGIQGDCSDACWQMEFPVGDSEHRFLRCGGRTGGIHHHGRSDPVGHALAFSGAAIGGDCLCHRPIAVAVLRIRTFAASAIASRLVGVVIHAVSITSSNGECF